MVFLLKKRVEKVEGEGEVQGEGGGIDLKGKVCCFPHFGRAKTLFSKPAPNRKLCQ